MVQDVKGGSLKEELRAILPQLEEMRKRKSERRHQFIEVQEQIQKISNEIDAYAECMSSKPDVDESDLSVRRLEELHRQLQMLQKEKVTPNFSLPSLSLHPHPLPKNLSLSLCLCIICLLSSSDWALFGSDLGQIAHPHLHISKP